VTGDETAVNALLIALRIIRLSFHYLSLSFILPPLLFTRCAASSWNAGLDWAIAMGMSGARPLGVGPLMRLRVPVWIVITVAFPWPMRRAVSDLSGDLSAAPWGAGLHGPCHLGWRPGAFYSAAPKVASDRRGAADHVGLFSSTANIGQSPGRSHGASRASRMECGADHRVPVGAGWHRPRIRDRDAPALEATLKTTPERFVTAPRYERRFCFPPDLHQRV